MGVRKLCAWVCVAVLPQILREQPDVLQQVMDEQTMVFQMMGRYETMTRNKQAIKSRGDVEEPETHVAQ